MRRLAWALAALVALPLLPACDQAKEGGVASVDVVVASSGLITLNGRPVNQRDLPAKLKKVGAGRLTNIRIRVPEGTSTHTLQQLASRLASSGYGRIVFSKPQKAKTSVKRR